MASGSNNPKFMTEAGIYVDSSGYAERFMERLQYNISDWIENGGDSPSDNLDEEEIEYILNHMESSLNSLQKLQDNKRISTIIKRSYERMTTVNEIYNQFNIPDDQRMGPLDLDIGNYTFTDMNKPDPFVWDFTNKNNSDILFRVHEDRMSFILYKKLDENHVESTTWRLGKKFQKVLDDSHIFNK